MILLLLAILIAGLVVFRRGWRGRVIDDHPWCVRCRFDLLGQPDGQPKCPECGASLHRPGSIAVGRREHRPRLVAAGAVMALLPAFVLSALFVGARNQVDWNKHKPALWLDQEMAWGSRFTQYRAAMELTGRANANSLAPGQVDRLIRRFKGTIENGQPPSLVAQPLADLMAGTSFTASQRADVLKWAMQTQSDESKPFPSQLGDMLYAAFLEGRLAPDEFQKVLTRSCNPQMRLLQLGPLAPGEVGRVRVDWHWRGGSGPFVFDLQAPWALPSSARSADRAWRGGPLHSGPEDRLRFTAPAEPGRHKIHATAQMSLGLDWIQRGLVSGFPALKSVKALAANLPDLSVQFPLEVEYEVAASADNAVSRVHHQLESMLTIGDPREWGRSPQGVGLGMYAHPFADQLSLTFEAQWRHGSGNTVLGNGTLQFEHGGSQYSFNRSGQTGSYYSGGGGSSGSIDDAVAQITIWVPTPAEETSSGTLVIIVTSLTIAEEPAPAGALPFTMELPVPVVR